MVLAFHHRPNQDGSYDTICLRCFLTVSTRTLEADLRQDEIKHDCYRRLLGWEQRGGRSW
jgi:hypothetical protein